MDDCDNLFKYSFMNKILVGNNFGLLHQNVTMTQICQKSWNYQPPLRSLLTSDKYENIIYYKRRTDKGCRPYSLHGTSDRCNVSSSDRFLGYKQQTLTLSNENKGRERFFGMISRPHSISGGDNRLGLGNRQ